MRHRASRGTSCVAVFRCRRRSSKISVVLRLGWISTQNRSGQSIVHLSFANVAWRRSFCVVAKYDWAHSNQFESRNQVVLWNTYVHSCEEYKDFCDRTSSVSKQAKHALFSSQLQDASDAMFEAFSMTEERLQAVSLACDDDGHDAPQPNKSVKPHPWYCNIRPIQSLDMKSSLACLVRICCKKHWEFVGNRPQVLCPQWLHPMPQLNEAENIVGHPVGHPVRHPVGHLLDIWTATESQAARAELRIAAHSCGPPGTYWFPWIGCAEPSLETKDRLWGRLLLRTCLGIATWLLGLWTWQGSTNGRDQDISQFLEQKEQSLIIHLYTIYIQFIYNLQLPTVLDCHGLKHMFLIWSYLLCWCDDDRYINVDADHRLRTLRQDI